MRNLLFFILLIPITSLAQSAKNVTYQSLQWVRYVNQLTINSRWGIQTEIDNRVFIPSIKEHHLVMRSQVRYAIYPQVEAAAGITYALQFPQDPTSESELVVPEIRVQHGITLKQELGRLKLSHRYLMEERFVKKSLEEELIKGYNLIFRFRYRLQAEVPLLKRERNELSLVLHDEAMLNFDKNIKRNVFDQNRVYGGLLYNVSPQFSFELGYMKWYQQRSSGIDYYNRNIIRLSIYHKIKLRNNVI